MSKNLLIRRAQILIQPMFDEEHFPRTYECEGCPETATVTYEDVQDVPAFLAATTAAEAVEYVMTERLRWSLESFEGAFCPTCTERRN